MTPADITGMEAIAFLVMGVGLSGMAAWLLVSRQATDPLATSIVGLAGAASIVGGASPFVGSTSLPASTGSLSQLAFFMLIAGAIFLKSSSTLARKSAKLEDALDELERALSFQQGFIDIMGHDLKTPLAAAKSQVQLYALDAPDPTGQLERIEDSLDQAVDIINESLIYSKLRESSELEREECDLVRLVQEAKRGLEAPAHALDVSIKIDSPSQFTYPASPLIQRAVFNLLSNAIKWSPRGGTVDVRLDPEDCTIRIADEGPGVPAEDRDRIFTRFERADRDGVEGTGLGLAIVKDVVEGHAGDVWVEESPRGGALFGIQLPQSLGSNGASNGSQYTGGVERDGASK